jgi:hypothetical protein
MYDLLFGGHEAPDGTPLGRAPGSVRKNLTLTSTCHCGTSVF